VKPKARIMVAAVKETLDGTGLLRDNPAHCSGLLLDMRFPRCKEKKRPKKLQMEEECG
jgi:hypothetical protein